MFHFTCILTKSYVLMPDDHTGRPSILVVMEANGPAVVTIRSIDRSLMSPIDIYRRDQSGFPVYRSRVPNIFRGNTSKTTIGHIGTKQT